MDDRAVSILDNYDLAVTRTYKGRGAILCETESGLKILKEYQTPSGKASLIEQLVQSVGKKSSILVDEYVRNKEGELISYDRDQKAYIVKNYFRGRECSPRDQEDLKNAFTCLAQIHRHMELPDMEFEQMRPFSPEEEMLKHNNEIRRVRNFIRRQKPKTDFELQLLKYYDIFEQKALHTYRSLVNEDFCDFYRTVSKRHSFAHGEYQYHNVLFMPDATAVVNFEHCRWDSRVCDLALFLRKSLEKSDWSIDLGKLLLRAYESEYPLTFDERKQLYYRLAYPEKFWKIINSYFNSNKAFVSLQYLGKLENLMRQETARERFLSEL